MLMLSNLRQILLENDIIQSVCWLYYSMLENQTKVNTAYLIRRHTCCLRVEVLFCLFSVMLPKDEDVCTYFFFCYLGTEFHYNLKNHTFDITTMVDMAKELANTALLTSAFILGNTYSCVFG